jgi:hypothetical protein
MGQDAHVRGVARRRRGDLLISWLLIVDGLNVGSVRSCLIAISSIFSPIIVLR